MISVIGEALIDLIDAAPEASDTAPGATEAYPGGSPANVSVALARLGQSVSLLTQLGDDAYGRMILNHLRDNGVRLEPGSLLTAERTSVARTSLGPGGHANYTFDIGWCRFRPADAPRHSPLRDAPERVCLHTGSIAAVLSPGAEDVLALLRSAHPSTMISYDPNCRPTLMGDPGAARERIERIVATSDIVKVSQEDLGWLHPGRPYPDVGREWLASGPALVVVTLGGQGAWGCTARGAVQVAARPVDVVDTVGAGDAFTAGLLAALNDAGLLGAAQRGAVGAVEPAVLTDVLAHACRVAAVTCTRSGADPPTLAELAARS